MAITGLVVRIRLPWYSHLLVYGCKALIWAGAPHPETDRLIKFIVDRTRFDIKFGRP